MTHLVIVVIQIISSSIIDIISQWYMVPRHRVHIIGAVAAASRCVNMMSGRVTGVTSTSRGR